MSPGELSLLLGVVPYGVLVGLTLSSPLSGAAFYLTYVLITLNDMREQRLSRFLKNSLLSLIVAVFLKFLESF